MQFSISFSSLLVSVLFVLLIQQDVEATPVKRQPKMVSMPLKRIPRDTSLHPRVYLQQQVNRADRRLARMTGREEPSPIELAARLHKRVVELQDAGHIDKRDKRYNRIGLGGAQNKRFYRPSFAPTTSNAGQRGLVGDIIGELGLGGQGKAAGAATGAKAGNAGATGAKGSAAGAAAGGKGGNATAAAGGAGGGIGGPDSANGQVSVANQPSGKNSLGLDIEGPDTGYLATIPMGTPPRNFLILMDSGSADLWVGGEGCQLVQQQQAGAAAAQQAGGAQAGGGAQGAKSQGKGLKNRQAAGCGNHQFLGAQSSSSFKDTQKPFQVTYGTGAVAGNIITDDINVAGLDLKAHTFGVAAQETSDFADDSVSFDGLMGLAKSDLSQQKTLTPVESLAQSGQIQDAITSYKISRLTDNKNDGEITFGGLDDTKFDAKTLVNLDNVSQQGFYEGNLDAVSVDGKDAGLKGRTAILDTGTTLIIAPAQDATTVLSAIPGAAGNAQTGFTVPCANKATVTMTFGGQQFDINPADMAAGPADGSQQDPAQGNPQTGDCLSGIQAGNIGGAQEWLVGDVFLKNAYFSTDATKNTLSLAKLV